MPKKHLIGLLLGGALLASAAPAQATTVTLRVEGKDGTLVQRQKVTLPTTPFQPDGTHDCAPNSGGGVLQVATGGDWKATYDSTYGYFLTTIKGVKPAGEDYWTYWVNGKSSFQGVCAANLQEGDDVLYFVDYCTYDPATYDCTNEPVLPLGLSVPQKAAPGSPVTVKVVRYAKDGTTAPVSGATVAGDGQSATTNSAGEASFALSTRGDVQLTASKPNFARDEQTTCVTDGADGFCGTTKPGETTTTPADTTPACVTNGSDGLCGSPDRKPTYGFVTSVSEGKVFPKGRGPQTLKGRTDPDPSGLSAVRLRLTRNDGGRCTQFSATKEEFTKLKRCSTSTASFFTIGDRADWSYQLPSKLPRGRYVLDVRTVDRAGNADTTLARGRNRVVFYVR